MRRGGRAPKLWTMVSDLALGLLCALAGMDLVLFVRPDRLGLLSGAAAAATARSSPPPREGLGRARWALLVAPLGALLALVARALAAEHVAASVGLALGLPVFACVAGFVYLGGAFATASNAARRLLAVHAVLAVVCGVVATLALETDRPLDRLAAAPETVRPLDPLAAALEASWT